MTSTRLLADRCASRVDAPIPPEVWIAFVNAAVALLMGCFADTSKAAAELERQRVGVIGRWRLRRAAKRAGIVPEYREAAIMVLLDESSRATPGELGALYHDALTAGIETGEFPAVSRGRRRARNVHSRRGNSPPLAASPAVPRAVYPAG